MLVNNQLDTLKANFIQFATDESADTSSGIDMKDYHSALLVIGSEFVASNAETLTYLVEIADSADNSSFSSYSTLKNAVVATATSATTFTGVSYLSINPASYQRYIKLRITATTSAGAGNVDFTSILLQGNPALMPVSQPWAFL